MFGCKWIPDVLTPGLKQLSFVNSMIAASGFHQKYNHRTEGVGLKPHTRVSQDITDQFVVVFHNGEVTSHLRIMI